MKFILENAQDPISCLTHYIGAVFSLLVMILYAILGSINHSSALTITSSVIFALSAFGLYFASGTYHYIQRSSKHYTLFRKIDHSMIYVLIAGSYTPIVTHYLDVKTGLIFAFVMWVVALFGIVSKIFWLNAPRILYTMLYILMGWAIVFYIPAFQQIEANCLILLASGGMSYTVGGVIYIVKKPNISQFFGFHELFHCFILGGTLFHFIAVALFVL